MFRFSNPFATSLNPIREGQYRPHSLPFLTPGLLNPLVVVSVLGILPTARIDNGVGQQTTASASKEKSAPGSAGKKRKADADAEVEDEKVMNGPAQLVQYRESVLLRILLLAFVAASVLGRFAASTR